MFSSALSSCSEKTASWESETRPLGFCAEFGLVGLLVVGDPDFVVPTTEAHGLAEEVLIVVLAVELLGGALGVVVGLRVVALMLVEFPEQRRDPLLFFSGPQSMSLFCTEVPRSLFERLSLTAHHV